MLQLSVMVPMVPRGKQRARSDGDHFYTPQQTVDAEAEIALVWQREHYAAWYAHVPLRLVVTAVVPRPRSVKRAHPTSRPDADNYLKLVLDALNGVSYEDDAQVVDARCIKRYAIEDEEPHIDIVIEEVI